MSGGGKSSTKDNKGTDDSNKKYHRKGSGYLLDTVVGCSDMVLLDPLTVENIVKNLKDRFNAGEIYTYIGNVVISINPYRQLDIYTPDYVAEYRSRNIFELPPHIYAISDDAYRSMRDRNKDQCIIISGESGAGKTEASKLIMQYVAQVTGKGGEIDRVKEQLLQSNPVLEAFGNAKTNKNDNSSRFGKYMDIEFDFKGDPVGGIIYTYLLEKSRVVHQSPGERNFHIFFQLLSGTDTDLLEMLHLKKDATEYHYLTGNDRSQTITLNHNKEFETTLKAMEIIGFTAEEISSMFELIAAILNIGNIEFEGYSLPNGISACKLKNVEAASYACDMLGCSIELLEQCLTKRSVETSKEVVLTPLSDSEGMYARDGLSKAIYERLFTWLVSRINERIKPRSTGKRKVIGVLDIYGFEVFESNSFEQFMINYCNEKLQQLFVELTIGSEQKEYIIEGIEWETVDFFDNSVICEIIEDPQEGIIAILNEECLRPGAANDSTFLDRLNQRYANNANFVSRASREHRSDSTLGLDQFRLKHYAGMVTYEVTGFMDKNRDLLFKDLSQAMFACERSILKTIFPEGDPEAVHLKRPSTTGFKFKSSVSEMIKNLMSKNPNYVRCIKPNDVQKSKLFEDQLVQTQTRYMNLLENIRVRRSGYAFRQSYDQALLRYKMLSSKTWPTWKRSPRDGIKTILQECGRKSDEYSYGRTKIFIRNPQTVFELESRRKKRMHDLAILISKNYRGWIERKRFQKIRNSQIIIAKHFRGSKCRKQYLIIRNATIVIQKYFRGWQVRDTIAQAKRIVAQTYASYVIRRYFYAWKLQKIINDRIYSKKVTTAAIIIQKYFKGWKVRKHLQSSKKEDAAPVITNFIKRALYYRFLVTLLYNLPSRSPLDKKWPRCSPMFRQTSILLRNMYHKWRCQLVRNYYMANPKERRRLAEKSNASTIFRGKKSLYPSSVQVAFIADRLRIRTDERWIKLVGGQKSELRIIWADLVQKMNRTDAKLTNRAVVVTATSLYILDTKHYQLQYMVSLSDIRSVSLSPHNDGFFIIHIKQAEGREKSQPKGDIILQSKHVIEGITKLSTIVQEVNQRQLPVTFRTDINVQLKQGDSSLVCFQAIKRDAATNSPMCRRKGDTFMITVD